MPKRGERQLRFKYLDLLLLLFLLIFACGAPMGPAPTPWSKVADIPLALTCNAIAESAPGTLLLVGEEDDFPTLYRYEDRVFARIFRYGKMGSFSGMGVYKEIIWTAGATPTGTELFILKYEPNSGWREIPVVGSGLRSISDVYPIGPDICWFGGTRTDSQKYGTALYENGIWKNQNYFPSPCSPLVVTPEKRGYVMHHLFGDTKVFISDDLGTSWQTEVVPERVDGFVLKTEGSPVAAARGNGLAFFSEIDTGTEERYWAIIGRNGVARAPNYNIEFYSPHGPYFYAVYVMAFRSQEDGFALGTHTSLQLKDGIWLLNPIENPGAWDPRLLTVGDGCYWAVVTNRSAGFAKELYRATM